MGGKREEYQDIFCTVMKFKTAPPIGQMFHDSSGFFVLLLCVFSELNLAYF